MKGYYFLGSILPKLELGSPLELSFDDLMTLFNDNLGKRDLEKVKRLRLYIDLKNVCQLLRKEPLDIRGNLTEKELDEALVNREGLPEYLYEFLEIHEKVEDQTRFFSNVLAEFFREEEKGFLLFYFDFERKWRLILTGMRAKKLNISVEKELQFEDPKESFIAEIIAQKDGPQFEFPYEFQEIGERLKEIKQDPMNQYKAMAQFRFKTIQEEVQDEPFSIKALLGFMIQFMIVEDWNALNEDQGKKRLHSVVKEIG